MEFNLTKFCRNQIRSEQLVVKVNLMPSIKMTLMKLLMSCLKTYLTESNKMSNFKQSELKKDH